MIIWRGKGLLVLLAMLIGGMAAGLVGSMANDSQPTSTQAFIYFLAVLVSGLGILINHLFCKTFLKNEGRKQVIDPQTGRAYILNNTSRFYYISNTTWTYILLIIYLIALALATIRLVDSFL